MKARAPIYFISGTPCAGYSSSRSSFHENVPSFWRVRVGRLALGLVRDILLCVLSIFAWMGNVAATPGLRLLPQCLDLPSIASHRSSFCCFCPSCQGRSDFQRTFTQLFTRVCRFKYNAYFISTKAELNKEKVWARSRKLVHSRRDSSCRYGSLRRQL